MKTCRCNEPTEAMQNPDTKPPTPIDPADIRPGDVVERVMRMTVARTRVTSASLDSTDGYAYSMEDDATWYLVHRPDPDAEAVEALRRAHRLTTASDDYATTLKTLRERGWDVVRRQT